jgi:hypothetical protein
VLKFLPFASRGWLALGRTLFKAVVPLVNVVTRAVVSLRPRLLKLCKLPMKAARHTSLISSQCYSGERNEQPH